MRLAALILPVLLVLSLAGCGVRGALQPPSAVEAPATAEDPAQPAMPAPAADRRFILDGLLL